MEHFVILTNKGVYKDFLGVGWGNTPLCTPYATFTPFASYSYLNNISLKLNQNLQIKYLRTFLKIFHLIILHNFFKVAF